MIPLSRRTATKRIELALLTYSRQSLPRPARLYSTPSKRNEASALATAVAGPREHYTPFLQQSPEASSSTDTSDSPDTIGHFLRRRVPLTFLPTPLPDDLSSPLNSFYFPDSPTQDSLAVIDACLHNCYDVPRAKIIFSRLRDSQQGDPLLTPKLYNLFLEAYLEMSIEKDTAQQETWIKEAVGLYDALEGGEEKVAPNAGTYAIMLKAWLKLVAEAENPLSALSECSPQKMLRKISQRHVSFASVVSDRVFLPEEAADVVQHLSRAAAELNMVHVISELGQVEDIAADPLSDVPEAVPVLRLKSSEDKEGRQGLEVPFNLENLRTHLAEVAYARRALPDDAVTRQKLLEASAYDVAVQRLKHEVEKLEELGLNQQALQQAQLQRWMYEWHEKLQSRLEVEIALVQKEEANLQRRRVGSNLVHIGPFLSLLKPQKLSLITILELMRLHGTGGVQEGMKTARALLTIGKAVELEHKAEVLKRNNVQLPASPARPANLSYFTDRAYKELKEWRENAASYVEGATEWTGDWTPSVRARVGSFLVDCLIDVAKVTRKAIERRTGEEVEEQQPAFLHTYEYLRGHKLGVLRLNPVVADRLTKDDLRTTLHPRHLPMLVKPKPWLNYEEGGYVYSRNSVMRLKDTQEQLTYLRHACDAGHMELIFAGLDVLGSTPWKINRSIFDVVLEVWNSGKRFCKIPPAHFDEPEPAKPSNIESDPAEKVKYTSRMQAWTLNKANCHSERCSVNYKVEIARAFLGDTIYLPHNIDFRGRAYPIPAHLNHMGNDLSRGLMKFAEAKPLGASGLRWLKIHVANLYGYDKGNFEERRQFVEDHLPEIYDSAEKPLEGAQWWTKADDPWQCLAACMELRSALESGNAEMFMSTLPVHQDGTCNGLQHYAALGGDIRGARQVNLDVTDRPADVYTHVADMVEEQAKKDAANGNKWAAMIQGKVARKVVKQTVMTTVYGVTFVGARSQIEKQLRDRGDIPADKTWGASSYLAKTVMGCIGDLFAGARDIQNWLNLSARLISKAIPPERVQAAVLGAEDAKNKPVLKSKKYRDSRPVSLTVKRIPKEQMTTVVWTTPLGLPIVQPYRKPKRKQIMTSLQTIFISDPSSPAEVNAVKQASAFPPNFIHSLDATHMMLTALECRNVGITFASVHDSYWTHASSIDQMNEIIRDTFIALHESDVLQKLQKEFLERYKDYQVPVFSLRSPGLYKSLGTSQGDLADFVRTYKAPKKQNGARSSAAEADTENSFVATQDVIEDASPGLDEEIGLAEVAATESYNPVDDSVSLMDEESLMDPPPKRKRKEKTEKSTAAKATGGEENALVNKFINLTDLLPPLPKKGEFDVRTIKKSKYFFS